MSYARVRPRWVVRASQRSRERPLRPQNLSVPVRSALPTATAAASVNTVVLTVARPSPVGVRSCGLVFGFPWTVPFEAAGATATSWRDVCRGGR